MGILEGYYVAGDHMHTLQSDVNVPTKNHIIIPGKLVGFHSGDQ